MNITKGSRITLNHYTRRLPFKEKAKLIVELRRQAWAMHLHADGSARIEIEKRPVKGWSM